MVAACSGVDIRGRHLRISFPEKQEPEFRQISGSERLVACYLYGE
jgi:hypothetical protein